MKRLKQILVIAVFGALVLGLFAAQLILPDEALSFSERRKLAQLPQISGQGVFSGEYMDGLEDYLLDQFPLRDSFRTVKALLRFYLFRQSDNNGVYVVDGSVARLEYPLKQAQVKYAASKINEVTAKYLDGSRVYYSIVPDKNWFLARPNGYPAMDYADLMDIMAQGVAEDISYIDITGCLEIGDYYATDTHWRQERIFDVALTLAGGMGAAEGFVPQSEYTAHTMEPFYGVYCGQSALPVPPDTLCYLTGALTDSAAVTGVEFEGERGVYSPSLFGGMDGYDVFLSGARSVLNIDVPDARTDRELIIFRDSYASSLAPLLIGSYSRITLVDLRYISSTLLADYVDFHGQDVLFLYSTSLLNSGMLLK